MNANLTTNSALPDGWKWARLGEVCEITKGTSITKKKTIPGDIPVIAGGQKPPYYHSEYNRDGETITVSASGAYAGFVSYHDYPIFASDCSTIKPQENLLSTKFLFALLKSKQDELYGLQIGSGQPHVYPRDLVNIHIPLPPLDEQRRIARVLDECLALVARAKDAAELQLEAAVALPGAYLRQALPAEGDDLPAGWKWARLGEVCYEDKTTIKPGDESCSSMPYLSLEHVESETGHIAMDDILSNDKEVLSNTFSFRSEHVLYGKLRPYLNKVALPDFSGRCTTEIIPLMPKDATREYLARVLRRPETVQFAMRDKTGSRMPRTDMKAFMKLPVPLPPLDEQERIASELDARIAVAGTLVSRIREQLDAIDALPGAYLRQAFAGEI